MNETTTIKHPAEETFFLTEVLGATAYLGGRKVGKLKDMVAIDHGKLAEVTHFQIARPFGDAPLVVPLSKIRSFSPREINVDNGGSADYMRLLRPEEVLLRDYLLDKKVLDMEGREVEVVYDMRLARTSASLYVSDVDISRYGLLRRMGLRSLADHLYRRAREPGKRLVPWSYVQALSPQLGSLEGSVKLTVLKEQLSEIQPADLADIVEELDSAQRVALLEGLDTEQASNTLEEVDPAVQRDIVFSLRKERAAQLIREMTPGQAADIVSVLPSAEKRAILALLEPVQVAKIEEILEKHETNILSLATSRFIKCSPDMTVAQAHKQFRKTAKSMDVLMYLYVVSAGNRLLGVIDLKNLLMAEDHEALRDLIVENVITLSPESTMKQASDAFVRYGFRALPVTDANDIMLGVVPYRDVMNLKHRILD